MSNINIKILFRLKDALPPVNLKNLWLISIFKIRDSRIHIMYCKIKNITLNRKKKKIFLIFQIVNAQRRRWLNKEKNRVKKKKYLSN